MNALEVCIRLAELSDNREVAYAAAAELARLQQVEQAAKNLQTRLDDHFGGDPSNDWKEQAELRAALEAK